MTWPDIVGLLKQFKETPPFALVAAGWVKSQMPKPIDQAIKGSGLPVRKGRIRKRGN